MESLKLYDTISFYRKKSGLTQEELAKKLGVINRYPNGSRRSAARI